MGTTLSDREIARYERDGFLFSIDVFGRDAARFREANREESLRYEAAP